MKAIGRFIKWALISIITVIILLFLFLWFVFLAPPKQISTAGEMTDNDLHTVALGGKTACSNGSPYAIFARKGKSDNLIIHFSGGGACWDSATCAAPITYMSLFDNNTGDLQSFFLPEIYRAVPKLITGLLSGDAAENPFKDWNVVFIPYCTGDLHVGNVTTTYSNNGKKFELRHNGRNNSLAALDWVFRNFETPGKILVSGESAGAWASAFWTPAVAQHYKNNQIYQLSDGSLLASNRWTEILDTVWKAESSSFLNFRIGNDIFEDAMLHRNDSLNYRIKHLQSNTVYDKVLTKFSAALNHLTTGNKNYIDGWSADMRASMQRIDTSGLAYEFFLSDCQYDAKTHSTPHTLTGRDYFNCNAGQVSFAEWLKINIIDDKPLTVGKGLLAK